MDRYTQKNGNEYILKENLTEKDLIRRLGQFEDMYESLLQEQNAIFLKMEDLKSEGKKDTATYRQLFANRLKNTELLGKFKIFIDSE